MRLRQVSMVQILLLLDYVLVHKLLAPTQWDLWLLISLVRISLLVGLRLWAWVIAGMLSVRIDDAPCLPRLQLPVLVLNMLGCHDLRLALSIGEVLVVGLHSTALGPVVRCLLHAVLVGVAAILVVCVLCLLVLGQLRLTGWLHLTNEATWHLLPGMPCLVLLWYLSAHAVVAGRRGSLVQLNVVQFDLSNV